MGLFFPAVLQSNIFETVHKVMIASLTALHIHNSFEDLEPFPIFLEGLMKKVVHSSFECELTEHLLSLCWW